MKEMRNRLRNAGIDNYLSEAKIIEKYAEEYGLDFTDLETMVQRRENHEPLQYLVGEWEFHGEVYKLNKDCFIPRPETEFLTEYIINKAKTNGIVLDLCSGSGCISISALKHRKDLTAVLIDTSYGAVEISKENAELHGVAGRTEFYCLDIIENFAEITAKINHTDMIVSNPPYLTKAEVAQIKSDKKELYYEPVTAFLGGDDGLDFYRFIIYKYSAHFNNAVTVLECGINQSKEIIKMFEKIKFSSETIRDYSRIERVVIGYK
jgi:release factor glutamine methyltransferase